MDIYVHIERGRYVDSLETLFATMVLNEQAGIKDGLAGMCSESFMDVARDMGVLSSELAAASAADYVIVARAESRERFETALAAVEEQAFASGAQAEERRQVASMCSTVCAATPRAPTPRGTALTRTSAR